MAYRENVVAGSIDHGGLIGLADDDHTQYHTDARGDARYFTEAEHLNVSAGAGDAGKPIKLDAGGQVDATMVNDADIDHGLVGGLADDDHTQYLLVSGARALTGAWAVGTQNITGIALMNCNTAQIATLTAGSVLFMVSGGNVQQNNTRFFWDNTNFRLGLGTDSPAARVHVLASTGITAINQFSVAGSDDVSEYKIQSAVETTDATTTTLLTITTAADTVNHFDAVITARRTGGTAGANGDSASYKYTATVKNVGGVLSFVGGTVANLFTREDQAGWAIVWSSSGSGVLLRVIGAADNTIKWHTTVMYQFHST